MRRSIEFFHSKVYYLSQFSFMKNVFFQRTNLVLKRLPKTDDFYKSNSNIATIPIAQPLAVAPCKKDKHLN
jgi:hypothetical protein